MRNGRRAAHYAVVAAIIGTSYSTRIDRVSFFKDESYWIATSYYLEALRGKPIDQIRPDVPRPLWRESYEILTQPPLARYAIGIGRRLGGFGVADLNGKWNYQADLAANEAAGNMPSERLLLWSRRPMALLAILSGLLLFSIARRCAGLLGGYVFALGFAFNPYLLETLRRAMGEATLTFFVTLALVATDLAARSCALMGPLEATSRSRFVPSIWWLVAGLCGGLAGAAKLNGPFVGVGAAVVAWVATRFGAGAPAALRLGAVGAVGLILGGTVIGFVVPNPYLYPGPHPGPISRMIELGVQRTQEMKHQRIERPDARLDGIAERLRAAARRVFFTHAIFQFPGAWALQGGFTLAGLLVLSRRALQGLRERRPGTELVVLVLGGCLVVPAILSPLDWARYYLFAVLFAGFCAAVGVSAFVRLALRRAVGHLGFALA
jgi:hypothetical protein